MNCARIPLSALLLSLGSIPFVSALAAQGDAPTYAPAAAPPAAQSRPRAAAGPDSRQAMWPAPTAEDWAKPCLIHWQRSYEDALEVSKQSGRPLLVCVNMDGEIASEHYAGVRYRQPEIAKLYEPYVCVIASVYRHNPRDYDEQGRRIPCPRFGTVTCGEHIAIEPKLYEQYFDAKRVAPRHVGLELERKEMYDIYYAWDTDTIFNALREGIATWKTPMLPIAHADRSILERVESLASDDRAAVEQAYLNGDHEQRRAILQRALAQPATSAPDLLRLAVRGLDLELAALARRALAATNDPNAVDLIAEALKVPMDGLERDALIAALERLGESSPRARTLATVHRGLGGRSKSVDVDDWTRALAERQRSAPAAEAYDRSALEARLVRHDAQAGAASDPLARIDAAEAALAYAVAPKTPPKFAQLLFQDGQRMAQEAERLGAPAWRVNAALAIAAFYLGEREQAFARAESAMAGMPADVQGWNAMAVLALFAQSRQNAIQKAMQSKERWPSQWLADVEAAYAVLARHPLGTEEQTVAHYDLLWQLGASAQAARVLDDALTRFPDSWLLHERLRRRALAERGVEGLEAVYSERLQALDAPRTLEFFAGYASFVAAEFQQRANKPDEALAAYDRAIAHYERMIALAPDQRANSDHYVALALAGKAWIDSERARYPEAVAGLLAALARRPEAAASLDGQNRSPVTISRTLLAKLAEAGQRELGAPLEAALAGLDPELLLPPEFDRVSSPETPPEGSPERPPRGAGQSRPGARER